VQSKYDADAADVARLYLARMAVAKGDGNTTLLDEFVKDQAATPHSSTAQLSAPHRDGEAAQVTQGSRPRS
jgi:hypothetical protein